MNPVLLVPRLVADKRATTAAELAVVLAILIVMIAAIVDYGRYFWFSSALQEVAADASRCNALYTSNLAFYTSQPYNYASASVTSPCSNLSSYVQSLAAARGVTIASTIAATPSCAPVITTAAYNSFNALTLTLTYTSFFGPFLPVFPTIQTSVCFPY